MLTDKLLHSLDKLRGLLNKLSPYQNEDLYYCFISIEEDLMLLVLKDQCYFNENELFGHINDKLSMYFPSANNSYCIDSKAEYSDQDKRQILCKLNKTIKKVTRI